jgi:hypothetical protein
MTEDEKRQIASLVVDELLQRLRIGVGTSILNSVWKVIVGALIAIALYGLAKSGTGSGAMPTLEIHRQ